jgi:FkbM family methyltransferase
MSATSFVRNAWSVLFVERRLPWRVEHWLSQRTAVQNFRARRADRWQRKLWTPYVTPGALVFDIGANVGDKTAILRELGGRVVSVEPDPRTATALRERFAQDSGITVIEAGVGAASGAMTFHLSPHTTRSSFVVDRIMALGDNCPFDGAVQVTLTTMDELIARHGPPAFCKIDVEGFEPEVFRGLSRPLPAIQFEFHGELMNDAAACLAHLESLGMRRFNAILHPVGGVWLQPTLDRWYLDRPVSRDELLDRLGSLHGQRLSGDLVAFQ